MRVLHAAVSMNPSTGVLQQMEWELASARELGLDWDVTLHTIKKVNSGIVYDVTCKFKNRLLKYIYLKYRFYKWLLNNEQHYDLILLRHSVHDIFEMLLSKVIGNKLITVHHTLEIEELSGSRFLGNICAFAEKYIGSVTLNNVFGVIAVTNEILNYELSRSNRRESLQKYLYPNGIHLPITNPLNCSRGDVPEIIFVASYFSNWHGLDLLIDCANKSLADCKIHIVGSVSDEDYERLACDPRFVVHGELNQAQISTITNFAWVGLSSFALFRKGMEEACTLKVREYLGSGIPVYAGHKDISFPNSFIYYKNGPLDLDSIIAYAISVRHVSRAEVIAKSSEFISKTSNVSRLYSKLKDDFQTT